MPCAPYRFWRLNYKKPNTNLHAQWNRLINKSFGGGGKKSAPVVNTCNVLRFGQWNEMCFQCVSSRQSIGISLSVCNASPRVGDIDVDWWADEWTSNDWTYNGIQTIPSGRVQDMKRSIIAKKNITCYSQCCWFLIPLTDRRQCQSTWLSHHFHSRPYPDFFFSWCWDTAEPIPGFDFIFTEMNTVKGR